MQTIIKKHKEKISTGLYKSATMAISARRICYLVQELSLAPCDQIWVVTV